MSFSAPNFDDLVSVFVDAVGRIGPVGSLHQLVELASSVFQPSDLDIDLVDLGVRSGVGRMPIDS